MPYTLVGSVGAVVTSSFESQPVSPAWGTGQSRSAGNLLIMWVTGAGATTVPTTPSGWSIAVAETSTAGSGATASIFYLIATGGDAAPTIPGVFLITWSARLAEFKSQ
jgi:hypothetical protein